jgi:hypothetical protein
MSIKMMFSAKPDHFKRFGVVRVMTVNVLGCTAHRAGATHKLAASDGVFVDLHCSRPYGVLFKVPFLPFPRRQLFFWLFWRLLSFPTQVFLSVYLCRLLRIP